MNKTFDSLIFDMDGTLWDAVDTYVEIWHETYRRMGVDATVTREQLLDCMGMPLDRIFDLLAPESIDRLRFETILREVDADLLPRMGGQLYEGVKSLIPQLAHRYRLFMVSNCGPDGLHYFLRFTGLQSYFTDTLTHGQTGLPKAENIRLLIDRYHLKSPVYIGDTQGDCDQAHTAGIPMVFASYGFGHCSDADFSVSSFPQLATVFLK